MNITWFGHACVKLQGKETSLVFDPYQPSIGLKLNKFQGQIVCVSHPSDPYNNVEAISGDPFVVDAAGEYEVKGVFIYGLPHENQNLVYAVEFEQMLVTHLGHLATTKFTEEQLERIEGTDILIIPVGGGETIDAKQAAEVIQTIEPRIVIPVRYKIPKEKTKLDTLDAFMKSQGVKGGDELETFKIAKKDLPQDKTETIILSPKI